MAAGVTAEDASAATRARLLDAVMEIASADGLDKVTYRSVGAKAGHSHSLVRFYFGYKDAMILNALERAAELDAAETRMVADDLESFNADFIRGNSGSRPRSQLQYDYLLRAVRGRVPLERVRRVYEIYISQVEATLSNAGIGDDDGMIAATVLATLDGIMLQHMVYESPERTEAMLEKVRHMLRLLRSDGSTAESAGPEQATSM